MKQIPQQVSESVRRRNPSLYGIQNYNHHPGENSVVERDSRYGSLAAVKGEAAHTGRILVRFESVRKRLCDPDNLSPKWILDSLRYAKIIPGDEPDKIELQVSQRKCRPSEGEHTRVEIEKAAPGQ
jgi:hypothetical protein